MPQLVFISPEGRLLEEDRLPKPSTTEDVNDCKWDMRQLAKLAEEQAKKQSTKVKE